MKAILATDDQLLAHGGKARKRILFSFLHPSMSDQMKRERDFILHHSKQANNTNLSYGDRPLLHEIIASCQQQKKKTNKNSSKAFRVVAFIQKYSGVGEVA